MERTPNKSQHTEVNSGEGNSPAVPAGIRTRNLSITSPAHLPTSNPGSWDSSICLPEKGAVVVSRTNTGTASHKTLGKLLKRVAERDCGLSQARRLTELVRDARQIQSYEPEFLQSFITARNAV